MGNSGSTTKLSTEINQKVYNELESVMKVAGSNSTSNQEINLEGVEIIVVGNENCKEPSRVIFQNENEMSIENTINAAAEAFAETVAELSSTISNSNQGGWSIGSTTIVDNTSNSEIQNAIKNKLQTDCGDANVRQAVNVRDSLMNLTCAELDISNKNTQNVACIMDSISEVTSQLDSEVTNKSSTSSGNTTLIIIAVVIIIVVIIIVILYVTGNKIILLIIIGVIVLAVVSIIILNVIN